MVLINEAERDCKLLQDAFEEKDTCESGIHSKMLSNGSRNVKIELWRVAHIYTAGLSMA